MNRERDIAANTIQYQQVTKRFHRDLPPAVDRVSLEVAAGELVVLLGPSGAGKTTLIKMVNRLYEPTSGRIYVHGSEIHDLPVNDLRRGIGYVIQQAGLFPHMSIEQNIAVVPELLKWDRRRIDQRIDELLTLVGLPLSYRKRRPRQLSGGEQGRVGLARGLAADPPILLMDEPFAALDAINRTHLQSELLRIQERLHKTILFVTHDVEEALRLADRIAILRHGRLVQNDTPWGILSRPENDFVRELVGADDVLRRLSLVKVEDVVARRSVGKGRFSPKGSEAPASGLPVVIAPEDNLRTALSRLLASADGAVSVVGEDGWRMGSITLADIRNELAGQSDASATGA